MLDPKEIVEFVLSSQNQDRIRGDYERYEIWNGKLKDTIKAAIRKEFALPETVDEMLHRITPLNIVQRITQKLAQVYRESPERSPVDETPSDQELIDLFAGEWEMDRKMKFADSMFELTKNFMLEPFINSQGLPRLRVLPSHTYTVLSDDLLDPTDPTHIIKNLVVDNKNPERNKFAVWTHEQHYIVNGKGETLFSEMETMGNPDGINPYGVIPFTYVKKSEDRLVPIADDDLISIGGKIIPILLTDLNFASKYQAWSLIAIIGAQSEKLSFNPNSVISLPEGSSIQTVKPQIDIDAMLRQIKAQLGMLLSSKGLKPGDTDGSLTVDGVASGVSKMIDNAESQEIREDRVEFFRCAEENHWYKFAHNILPVWVENKLIDTSFAGRFSEDFELSIKYPEMKLMLNEQERVANAKAKEDAGYITKRMAIKEINPELGEVEIEAIMDKLKKESLETAEFVNRNFSSNESELDGPDSND